MKIGRLNFQYKLIIYFSSIFIVLIFISGTFSYTYTAGILQKNMFANMENLSQKMASQLDVILREMDRIAVGMIGNEEIIDILYAANQFEVKQTSQKLEYQRVMNRIVMTVNTPLFISSRITLFNREKGFFITLGESQYDKSVADPYFEDMDWIEQVIENDGGRTIIAPHQDNWSKRPNEIFSISRLVKTPSDIHLAILEVQKPYSDLEALSRLESDLWNIYIFNKDGQLFYPMHSQVQFQLPEAFFSEIQQTKELSSSFVMNDTTHLFSSYYSDYSNLYTVVTRSSQELTEPVVLVRNLTFLIGGIMLLITIFLTVIITRRLTQPMKKLRQSLQKVQLENLSLNIMEPHSNDELLLLNEAFQSMFERLKRSIDETVIAKEEEAKSRFLALQSQMNPHFLYNTLNTIAIFAEENQQPDIMNMCRYLTRMLQYVSTYENAQVTMAEELEHVQHYMMLMKCRYESRMTYDIRIEGIPGNIIMPKLIIQPLVENSFKHGLQHVSHHWMIEVDVLVTSHGWRITISDNGAGFQEQVLRNLQQEMEQYSKQPFNNPDRSVRLKGKGILNTFIRLQHFYRGQVHFYIANNPVYGAKITITTIKERPA